MSVDIKSEYPVDNPAFLIRPVSPEEAGLFYTLPPEQEVVDGLRQSVRKSFSAITGYCWGNVGEIRGGQVQNYGYIVETENYRYCLRCNPVPGDYQAYLTAIDLNVQRQNQAQGEKPVVGRVSFASGERMEYTDAAEYL